MKAKTNNKNFKKVDSRESIKINTQMKSVDIGVHDGVFIFSAPLTLGELSKKINKSSAEIIKYFFLKGIALNLNTILTIEQIGEICLENNLDFKIEKEINEENVLDNISFDDDEKNLEIRAPIVTIMGHVDHGKTTLLDYIRKTSVTTNEAGGITQHIGAYQIKHENKFITFIDTPGHEAFSEMRARGANLTDIIILVVAADDGVKLQTEEAIDHAKLAKAKIIVFVNKMDKVDANPEKVISQLSERDIICEKWGGDITFVEGSALNGSGVDKLIETILLTSEIMELKANPNRLAYGTIIESNLDKGLGPIATILIQNGTLNKGDYLVAGHSFGRIRLIQDENKNFLEKAGPSKPVIIAGLEKVPSAGDKFLSLKNEKDAKIIAEKIKNKLIKEEQFNSLNTDIRTKIASGELKNVNVLIKVDVHGSLEAIKGMVSKLDVNGANITIIRAAIGQITESDIRLAQTSNALIIAFNIRPSRSIVEIAIGVGITITCFDIIYKLKEELESLLAGSLDPIYEEEILGELEVMQIWHHSDIGSILGCRVTNGKVIRNAKCRVIRDGIVVYTSEISSLKHGKDQITECLDGKECGLTIKNFNDVKEGDIIETFRTIKKKIETGIKNG